MEDSLVVILSTFSFSQKKKSVGNSYIKPGIIDLGLDVDKNVGVLLSFFFFLILT